MEQEHGKEFVELAGRLAELIVEEHFSMKQQIEFLRSEVGTLRKQLADYEEKKTVKAPCDIQEEQEKLSGGEPWTENLRDGRDEVVEEPVKVLVKEPVEEPVKESVKEPVENDDDPVLMPRSLTEQNEDTSLFGSGDVIGELEIDEVKYQGERFWNMEDEEEQSPAWMTDIPGGKVDSVYDAVSDSDRLLFIRELFDGDEEQYDFTMARIDKSESFQDVLSEMRAAFPMWKERTDTVYNFYMAIRRKFR